MGEALCRRQAMLAAISDTFRNFLRELPEGLADGAAAGVCLRARARVCLSISVVRRRGMGKRMS